MTQLEKTLIDALTELLIESINNYDLLPNSHRKSAEEYYSEEIGIVEKAKGMRWNDIIMPL